MKIIQRDQILGEDYKNIIETESHHRHDIIEGEDGTLRWKGNKNVKDLLDGVGGLNPIMALLYHMGYDKNSEVMRQLYRDLGVSLDLYWEVFYWEANNPEAANYKNNTILI
jgi:hypothetical protein